MQPSAAASTWEAVQTARQVSHQLSLLLTQQPLPRICPQTFQVPVQHILHHHQVPAILRIAAQRQASLTQMGLASMILASRS